MSAVNIQIQNGVTLNGVTIDGSNKNAINHNGLKLYLDAADSGSYQNLTTTSAQSYSDGSSMSTFRVLNRGGNWDEFFTDWTSGAWSCVEFPGSRVTNMTNPGDDSPVITITGGTFVSGQFYTFTASNTWADLSGNNNHVAMTDPAYITHTDSGGSYFTLSESGYFTNANPTGLPVKASPYHFSAWVQWPGGSWPSSGGIMSIGSIWEQQNQVNAFRTTTTNGFVNYWWGNDFAVSTALATTQWCNVVAQWDGTTRSIWANGQLIGSQAADSLNVTNNFLQIGTTYTGLGENLSGNIGQVLIYNRALAPLEIQNNFNATRSRYGI